MQESEIQNQAKNNISFQELIGASQKDQTRLFLTLFLGFSFVLGAVAVSNIDLLKVFNSFFSIASSEGIFSAIGLKLLDLLEFFAYTSLILSVAYALASMCYAISNLATVKLLRTYVLQEIEDKEFLQRAANFFAFARLNNRCISISKDKGVHHMKIHVCRTSEDTKANFATENPLFNLDPIRFSSNYWMVFLYLYSSVVFSFLTYKLGTSTIDSKICIIFVILLLPALAGVYVRRKFIAIQKDISQKIVSLCDKNSDTSIDFYKEMSTLMSSSTAPLPVNKLERKFDFYSVGLTCVYSVVATVLIIGLGFFSPTAEVKYTGEKEDLDAVSKVVAYVVNTESSRLSFKLASTEANYLHIEKLPAKNCDPAANAIVLKNTSYCTHIKTPKAFLDDVQKALESKED